MVDQENKPDILVYIPKKMTEVLKIKVEMQIMDWIMFLSNLPESFLKPQRSLFDGAKKN